LDLIRRVGHVETHSDISIDDQCCGDAHATAVLKEEDQQSTEGRRRAGLGSGNRFT